MVLGILIALQINDWHQQRLDRQSERVYLTSMKQLQPNEVFEPLVPEGKYLASDDPALIAEYYEDMLYHRTALNILTLMYRRQPQLAEPLSARIETQYGI